MSTKKEAAIEALRRVSNAIKSNDLNWSWKDDHPDWNPNAHLGITITVEDARRVHLALIRLKARRPASAIGGASRKAGAVAKRRTGAKRTTAKRGAHSDEQTPKQTNPNHSTDD